MGREAKCALWQGRKKLEGKALLETDEVLFRAGDTRLRIALKGLKSVSVDGDCLVLDGARLELGAHEAALWAKKITQPPSLLDKLAIKPGDAVHAIGAFPAAFTAELRTRATAAAKIAGARAVLLAIEEPAELARVAATAKKIAGETALWVVYPKGRKDLREVDVLGAGRDAGLADTKVARFSDTHTALRFVVRVRDRR